jgi:formate hydrogenlyase subunit 3/multisubunit Na+/H+ antiporter MnhD subunit
LLASSFFLFLATILTYQTAGNTEFSNIGILQDLSFKRYFALLVLFIFSIASIALFPIHLFFKKLYHLNAPIIIMIFVISYGLVNLLILLKIILNIFGFEYFIKYANKFNLSYVLNFIIGLNLIISAFLALAQNNLKKILIFLFFNQLIFSYFLFLILNQTIDQFIITIISFIFSQSLIFLCLGNINIYLLRAREKSLAGIFFKLKNSSFLLFFGLFSLIGIVPSIGLIEKYIIVENYLISDFNLNLLVIFTNIIFVGICLIRVIFITTQKSSIDKNYDYELAKAIDRNVALIMPPFIIAILMFLFFVFFKYINNYLKLFLS